MVRSMSFEDSSRGQMSSATNPEAHDHGADDEAGLRIVDHARAYHGADGLAGDHAAAIERGDGASRFAAPISRIRAGLQIHDHTQIAASWCKAGM